VSTSNNFKKIEKIKNSYKKILPNLTTNNSIIKPLETNNINNKNLIGKKDLLIIIKKELQVNKEVKENTNSILKKKNFRI
jgi:hypothetical protein